MKEKLQKIRELVAEISTLCEGTDSRILMVCEGNNIDIDFYPKWASPRNLDSRQFVGVIRENSDEVRYNRIIKKLERIIERMK